MSSAAFLEEAFLIPTCLSQCVSAARFHCPFTLETLLALHLNSTLPLLYSFLCFSPSFLQENVTCHHLMKDLQAFSPSLKGH